MFNVSIGFVDDGIRLVFEEIERQAHRFHLGGEDKSNDVSRVNRSNTIPDRDQDHWFDSLSMSFG